MKRQSNTYMAHAIADKLRAEGTPFAVATVVRTLASTAAKPGMKALVLGNGDFADGWLGGSCVTAAVKKAAIATIKTGEATLVCLRPEELLADIEVPLKMKCCRWRTMAVQARDQWIFLSNQ